MFSENEVTITAIDVQAKEPSTSSAHSVYKVGSFNSDSYINSNYVSSVCVCVSAFKSAQACLELST